MIRGLIKPVFTGVVAAAVLAGAGWAAVELRRPERFVIRSVHLSGEFKQVTREQVIAAITGVARGNLFMLDLDTVKARVEAVPWVHRAAVRRVWPPALDVDFTEQRIAAAWEPAGWLNRDGEWVDLKDQAPTNAAVLPRLAGPADSHAEVWARYVRLSEKFDAAGLHLTRLELSARRTWRLQLDNKLVLLVGREPIEGKLDRFLQAHAAGLGRHQANIKQIDLRYTHGFAVAWSRPAAAPLVLNDSALASGGLHYVEEKR